MYIIKIIFKIKIDFKFNFIEDKKMKLLYLLFFSFFFLFIESWTIDSWRGKKPNIYIQKYKNKKDLKKVENRLKKCAPLVTGSECDDLKRQLRDASFGKRFLLIGGDCAESFHSTTDYTRDMYRILLQMGIFLSYSNGLPTTKIVRMAGQYAKPRSSNTEILPDGKKIQSYKGDIINDIAIHKREADPERMLTAYHKSVQILNLLRSFSFGGYASVHNIDNWKLDNSFSQYNKTYDKYIKDGLRFMKGLDLNIDNPIFTQTKLYTGHESLLLNYEESLTRKDTMLKRMYGCSSHFLWIGERTRDLNSPHIEYLSGISNPIGIKLSHKIKDNELISLIKKLNPDNEYGKITLITRFGIDKIEDHLPRLIEIVEKNRLSVLWCCDPMHGNTKSIKNGIKTRYYNDILDEILTFFKIHKEMKTVPGGIHLEMTPDMVTECIDYTNVYDDNINDIYESKCDPRLNGNQSISLICELCDYLLEN